MAKQFNMESETFRVSFPYLATPSSYPGEDPKYQLDAIFDPQTAGAFWNNLTAQIQQMLAQEYPGQEHLFQLPQMKDGNANIAKTDPAQQPKNGYAGTYYTTFKSAEPVGCVKFDMAQGVDINIDPKQVYSGCYARAFIQAWIQDNSFGKRVNLKLLAIKFVADGESLGGVVPVDPTAAFAPGAPAAPVGVAVAQPAGLPVGIPAAQGVPGAVPGMPPAGAPVAPNAAPAVPAVGIPSAPAMPAPGAGAIPPAPAVPGTVAPGAQPPALSAPPSALVPPASPFINQ
jgi:hypothetical protein